MHFPAARGALLASLFCLVSLRAQAQDPDDAAAQQESQVQIAATMDVQARAELAQLRAEVQALREEVVELRRELTEVALRPPAEEEEAAGTAVVQTQVPVEGTVERVEGDVLVVKDRTGPTFVLRIEDAQVVAGQLEEGAQVRTVFEPTAEGNIVRRLEVLNPPAQRRR